MRSISSFKRFPCLMIILLLPFLLASPLMLCSGDKGQEKPLEQLLKKGLEGLMGEVKIDSMQIVEESDYRLVVEVAYSGIKILMGHKLMVEPFGYNYAALPGFECETKVLSQTQGTLHLAVLYRGSGAQSKIQSTGLQTRLFITPKNPKARKLMDYFKNWIAAPSGYTPTETGGYTATTTSSGEGVVIDPVPMFRPEELTPVEDKKPPDIKQVPKKTLPPLKMTVGKVHPVVTAISANDYYKIEAKSSGRCLDVSALSMENGANVYQWEWVGGANQQWKLVQLDDGCYEIAARHSGKCLDVADWSKQSGANVQQWDWHGGDNQRWRLIPLGDGYYKIVSKLSGKCLDVQWGGNQNGANVWQWDDIGSDAQKWKLIIVK